MDKPEAWVYLEAALPCAQMTPGGEMTLAEWEAAGRPTGAVVRATVAQMEAAGVTVARPVHIGTFSD